jgi:5-methylcytosine-specific restriction endonuclease McrA
MPWPAAKKSPAYGTPAWKRARLECLRRARWRCEIRTEGICIGTASQADHILGLEHDPHHTQLRAACKPCHAKITAQQGHDARRGGTDPDFTGSWAQW